MLQGLWGSTMQEEGHVRMEFPHLSLMHDIILVGIDVIIYSTT